MVTTQLVAGNTLQKTWTLLQSNMAAVNLAGCTASYGVVPVLGGEPVFTASTSDIDPSITIPNPASGTIVLQVSGATTAVWPPALYNVGLTMTFSNGDVLTYDLQSLQVLPAI